MEGFRSDGCELDTMILLVIITMIMGVVVFTLLNDVNENSEAAPRVDTFDLHCDSEHQLGLIQYGTHFWRMTDDEYGRLCSVTGERNEY